MRALGSSVLAFEIIIAILFIPAAIAQSSVGTNLIVLISVIQIVLAVFAMGTMGKKYGIYLGYLTQIFIILTGFIVTWMFVLGLMFLGLWIMALRIGRRTDAIKAAKKAS